MEALCRPIREFGDFIPLIVVNCIILGRAEALPQFTSSGYSLTVWDRARIHPFLDPLRDNKGDFRCGTLFGMQIMPQAYNPAVVMILPPGAFVTLGLLLGLLNKLTAKNQIGRIGHGLCRKIVFNIVSTVLVNNFVLSNSWVYVHFLECQKGIDGHGHGGGSNICNDFGVTIYLYNTICNIGAESGISTDHCFYIGCCASSICRDGYSKDESNPVSGSRRLPSLITTNCAV